MFLRMENLKWIVQAPAKLNLYLAVQGRRPDGYHELQTLMAPIALFDSLVLEPVSSADQSRGDLRLQVVAEHSSAAEFTVPTDETNLVVRALDELRLRTGCRLGANVSLVKRIPAGAGLGGGSSDAAAALAAANRAWGLNLARCELAEVAAKVGSDVPFFLGSRPAVCTGRGEIVSPLDECGRFHVVVATPQRRLGSASVYAALRETDFSPKISTSGADFAAVVEAFRRGNVGAAAGLLYNALQRAAIALEPGLTRIQTALSRWSGGSAVMSGSGSSFFCLCRTAREARRGAAHLQSAGFSFAVATNTYAWSLPRGDGQPGPSWSGSFARAIG